jgi:hypothetical protein
LSSRSSPFLGTPYAATSANNAMAMQKIKT